MGQANSPPTVTTTQCAVRALMLTLTLQPPHVCHRHGDLAVATGSGMPHDTGISMAPRRPGGRASLSQHTSETHVDKIGDTFSLM